jgi:Protein of unknown function (DUF2442)
MKPSNHHFLPEVIEVKPLPEYQLRLKFQTGESRLFDFKPLLQRRPFDRLLELGTFNQACVGLGTVLWPNNIDIAPETLYERSTPL